VLQSLTDANLSNGAFPWLSAQDISVGLAPDVRALRVNFIGELGWEPHHPIEYQNHLFDALMAAGEPHGLTLFGMRALDSMRLEKSYRMWGSDLVTEYSALESGLDRFVRLDKGEFVGRAALLCQREDGLRHRLVTMKVDVDGCDPLGSEPVYADGIMVGRATSGAHSHTFGCGLSLAYVGPEYQEVGTQLEIELLGVRHRAEVCEDSPYDPENTSLRA
jgi:dimethylglycine dehydrogenase